MMVNRNKKTKNSSRTALGSAVALLFPPLIVTVYLWLSRTYDFWNGTLDYFALTVSIATGLIGVFLLPLRRVWRFVIAAIYVPIVGYLLFFWALMFVCSEFGACL